MGLRDWLTRIGSNRNGSTRELVTSPGVVISTATLDSNPLVKLAGTTTVARQAAEEFVRRRGLADRDMLVCRATLEREPDNPADSQAVAVHVDGGRIGYVPSYVAKLLPLPVGKSRPVQIQLFCLHQDTGVRVEGWAWLADSHPRWQYTAKNPPPLTTQEKRSAEAQHHSQMVAEALAGGGKRAAQFQAGMVNGVHYLELIEPIKQLKREGQLREALRLCYQAIEGAERGSQGLTPAPWYTEQAAIIHRKLGEGDEEVAVLQRWLSHTPPERREGSKIAERLAKVRHHKP